MKSDFKLAIPDLNRIGIVRVSTDFYTEPKRKGTVFFVRSPAGTDRTASLALFPNSNRFTDFSNANYSGDMILSILVDTFFARISMPKLQSPEIRNISAA